MTYLRGQPRLAPNHCFHSYRRLFARLPSDCRSRSAIGSGGAQTPQIAAGGPQGRVPGLPLGAPERKARRTSTRQLRMFLCGGCRILIHACRDPCAAAQALSSCRAVGMRWHPVARRGVWGRLRSRGHLGSMASSPPRGCERGPGRWQANVMRGAARVDAVGSLLAVLVANSRTGGRSGEPHARAA
jgi:hypothetical protein